MAHRSVGWDKETAVWWAGACHRVFCGGNRLFFAKLPFPPAHQQLRHACPTLRAQSGLTVAGRGSFELEHDLSVSEDGYVARGLADGNRHGFGLRSDSRRGLVAGSQARW